MHILFWILQLKKDNVESLIELIKNIQILSKEINNLF
jgi:hypothetical protein